MNRKPSRKPGKGNARHILPKELYEELMVYTDIRQLHVPPPQIEQKGTLPEFIWELHCKGYQVKMIARITKVTQTHVYRILQKKYGNSLANRLHNNMDIWRYQYRCGYKLSRPERSPEEMFSDL